MEDKAACPTISRTLADGTLVELLFDPALQTTALAICAPGKAVRIAESHETANGERLIPYSPSNNLIATGCLLLASELSGYGRKADLLNDVQGFLHRYVDLSPAFEAIAAHYVLLTWVYDAFNELPYLRLRGDYGTGKTRGLFAIGSLCYKPFFASGASTVSPIFHVLDAARGTLVLDEADFRFSDATAQIAKILNNGNARGMPVLRTMANRHRELNPRAFDVFGPKIIAMRRSFADPALESRFITEDTQRRSIRCDIPIQTPPKMRDEARALRGRLLAWRFAERHGVASDPSRLDPALSPRANQVALSLLSLIDDPELRQIVCGFLKVGEASVRHAARAPVEALMLGAILAAYAKGHSAGAAIGLVTDLFNAEAERHLGRATTPKWVGAFVRGTLGLPTRKQHGVFAIPPEERARVSELAKRYALSPT